MNIKRGLFRLWLVFSIFWIAGVGLLGADTIKADKWWKGNEWWEDPPLAFLPVQCGDARGVKDKDYEAQQAFEPWNIYRTPSTACFYTVENFRRLFPEYKDLSREDLSKKLYAKLDWAPAFDGDRFEHTKTVTSAALIPPLATLLCGSLIFWAFAGFSSKSEEEA
jgi:hypothetical protein